jgi:hypothetical protein
MKPSNLSEYFEERPTAVEGCHGFAGASRTSGGLGGPFEERPTAVEGCHGFAGASRTSGGLGGPFEAPHV